MVYRRSSRLNPLGFDRVLSLELFGSRKDPVASSYASIVSHHTPDAHFQGIVQRFLPCLRCTFHTIQMAQWIEFVEDNFKITRNYIVLLQLLWVIFGVAHITACAFCFVSTLNPDMENHSWIAEHGFIDVPISELYTSSLYWTFTMMTTVGFGDIVPITHSERLFSVIAMLVSAGTYAYTIASISAIVANMNVTKSMYFEKLNELNAYMRSQNLPRSLQLRTRKYYRYYLKRKTVHNETSILQVLPKNLREEITDHYIRNTIDSVKFFHQVDRGFTTMVVMNLRPTFYLPAAIVIKAAEVADEMFVITKGVLQVSTDQDSTVAYLYDGDHFGEMALLLEEQASLRCANVRATSYSELYAISYACLLVALTRYSDSMDKLMEMALERRSTLKKVKKSSKSTSIVESMQSKWVERTCSMMIMMIEKTIDKRFRKLAAQSRQIYTDDAPAG